jgi:hypothetical protein
MVHVGDTPFAVTLQDAQWTLTGVVVRLKLHRGQSERPLQIAHACPALRLLIVRCDSTPS